MNKAQELCSMMIHRDKLSPQCMICGKPLTDPASMARMIGPECFGSGSLNVPWLCEADKIEVES